MANDAKKPTFRSQRQAERAKRRASHAVLRKARRTAIRRAIEAQEAFMTEYVRVGGDLRAKNHPLAGALSDIDDPGAVKAAVSAYYASLETGSEGPR